MKSRSFVTTGIILKMKDLGESDRFITVYTQDRGKLTCIGKNIRTLKSRRSTQIELLNRVQLQLWESRHHYYLTECKAEERFSEMKQTLPNLSSATFVVEVTERLTPEGESIEDLFKLLNETLNLMEFYPQKHDLLRETYLLKLMNLLGTVTSFRECSLCRQNLPEKEAYLDPEHSTLYCARCRKTIPYTLENVPLQTLKLIHFILKNPMHAVLQLKITPDHLETLRQWGRFFLRQTLQYPLKSEMFLNPQN